MPRFDEAQYLLLFFKFILSERLSNRGCGLSSMRIRCFTISKILNYSNQLY